MELTITKEELQQALDNIKNEYDAFYFSNKYGEGTHHDEFMMLHNNLDGDKVSNALGWIQNCYDCYYKDECQKGDVFDYLQGLIDNYGAD